MRAMRMHSCSSICMLLLLGWLRGREDLLRLIENEVRNASVFELLAQLFQDVGSQVAGIYRTIAEEEGRHAVVLKWCYQKRFGFIPAVPEKPTVDSKALGWALHAGLHRLTREKPGMRQRIARFIRQRTTGAALPFMR